MGIGTLSVGEFEVKIWAAPTLPSFDVPASVESELVPCERLSAARVPTVAETACATEAAVAAVTAADTAADDACSNAATDAPAAGAPAAAPGAGPLTAAAPDGRSPSALAKSSVKVEAGAGTFVLCAIAAAMTACAAASVPVAAGPVLNVESFSALASAGDDVELADADVPALAVASPNLAASPARAPETVGAFDVPGVARIRVLATCGSVGPDETTLGALAADGVVASTPAASAGGAARDGGVARDGGASRAGVAAGTGAAGGVAAAARFSAAKIVAASLALGCLVDAAAVALGEGP